MSLRRALVIVGRVDSNRPPETNMTATTILLNLGLAPGTSVAVATAMTVLPDIDRIHLHRRLRGARRIGESQSA